MPLVQVPHTAFPDTLTEIKAMYQHDISKLKQDILLKTSPGQPCIFDFDCPQVLAAMARGSISQPHLAENKTPTQTPATVYVPLLYRYYPLGSMGLPGYPRFQEGSKHRNNWTQALWEGYFDTIKCLPEFFLAMIDSVEHTFPKKINGCCPKSLMRNQSCSLYYLKGNIYCNHGYTNNLLATNYLNLGVFKPTVAISFEETIARLWLGEKDYAHYPYMFVYNAEYLACPNADSHSPGSVIAIQNGLVCAHGYANAVNWSLFPNREQTESFVLKVARDTNEMIMPMEKQQVHRTWNNSTQIRLKQGYGEGNSGEQGTMASPLFFSRRAILKKARMTLNTKDRGVKVANVQLKARHLRKIANDAVGIYSQFCRSEVIPYVLCANYILEDSTSGILQWYKDPPPTQKFRSLTAQVVRKLRAKHILALLLEELLKAYHDDPDSPVSQVKLLRFCSEHLMSKKKQKQKVSEEDDCEAQFRDLQLEEPTGTKESITGNDRSDRLNVARATTVDDGISATTVDDGISATTVDDGISATIVDGGTSDIENDIRKLKQSGTETDDTSMSDEDDELSEPPKCSPDCRFCRQEQEARQAKEKEEKDEKGYDSDDKNKEAAMFIDGTHDNDGNSDTDTAANPHSGKWIAEEELVQSCCLHGVQNPIRLGSFEAYCYAKQPHQACNSWERVATHYTQMILAELKESILPRPVPTTITEAETVVWSATSFTIQTILNFIRTVMRPGTSSNDGLGANSKQCSHGHIKLQRKPNGHFVGCEATQPVSECGIVSGYLHELSEWGNILSEVDFASPEVHTSYSPTIKEEEIISSPDLMNLNQVQDEMGKEASPRLEYRNKEEKQDMDTVTDHPESASDTSADSLEMSYNSEPVRQQQSVEDMTDGDSGITIDGTGTLGADSSVCTVNTVNRMEADDIKVPDCTAANRSVNESSVISGAETDTNDTAVLNASNKDTYRCYKTGSHISAFDDPCYDGKIDTIRCIHGNRAIITHYPWHARCEGKTETQWCPISSLRNQLSLPDPDAMYKEMIEAATKWCPHGKKTPYLYNGQELTCDATNYFEACNIINQLLKTRLATSKSLRTKAQTMETCIHGYTKPEYRLQVNIPCNATEVKEWCPIKNQDCLHNQLNPSKIDGLVVTCTASQPQHRCTILLAKLQLDKGIGAMSLKGQNSLQIPTAYEGFEDYRPTTYFQKPCIHGITYPRKFGPQEYCYAESIHDRCGIASPICIHGKENPKESAIHYNVWCIAYDTNQKCGLDEGDGEMDELQFHLDCQKAPHLKTKGQRMTTPDDRRNFGNGECCIHNNPKIFIDRDNLTVYCDSTHKRQCSIDRLKIYRNYEHATEEELELMVRHTNVESPEDIGIGMSIPGDTLGETTKTEGRNENKDIDSMSSVDTVCEGVKQGVKRKHLPYDMPEAAAIAMPPLKRLCIHNNIRKDFRRGALMECVASSLNSWCITQNDTCVHGLYNPHLHKGDTTTCIALSKESPCNIMQLRAGVEFKAKENCGITVKRRPNFLPLPRKHWSPADSMITRRRAIADKLVKAHNNVAALTALGYNYTIRVPVNSLQGVLKDGYKCIHGANGPNIRSDDTTIVFCTATTQQQLCPLIHKRCAHGYPNPLRSSTGLTYCYASRYPLYIAPRSQPPCPIDCKLRHCTRRVQMRPHAPTCHYGSRKRAGKQHIVPFQKPQQ